MSDVFDYDGNNNIRYFMALEQTAISHYRNSLIKKHLKKWKLIKNNIKVMRKKLCERLAIRALTQRTKFNLFMCY
jgi:hypothetical protein